MPTVVQFNPVMASATKALLPTVRMMSRRLIDDDLMPKGSGRRVPKVTYEQATMLLLAVLAAQPVKDATRAALTYAGLVHDGMGDTTALQAISNLLRSLPQDPEALDWSILLCMTYPQVELKKKTYVPQMPHPSERTDGGNLYIPKGDDPMHWPSDDLQRFVLLPGIRLYEIARALAADE